MEWLDNGPGWVGVLLADAAAVLRTRPAASTRPGRTESLVLRSHSGAARRVVTDHLESKWLGDGPTRGL